EAGVRIGPVGAVERRQRGEGTAAVDPLEHRALPREGAGGRGAVQVAAAIQEQIAVAVEPVGGKQRGAAETRSNAVFEGFQARTAGRTLRGPPPGEPEGVSPQRTAEAGDERTEPGEKTHGESPLWMWSAVQ